MKDWEKFYTTTTTSNATSSTSTASNYDSKERGRVLDLTKAFRGNKDTGEIEKLIEFSQRPLLEIDKTKCHGTGCDKCFPKLFCNY